MNTYKKTGGSPPAFCLLPFALCLLPGVFIMQYSAACNTCKTFPQGSVSGCNDAQANAVPTTLAHCGRLRGKFLARRPLDFARDRPLDFARDRLRRLGISLSARFREQRDSSRSLSHKVGTAR